MQSLMDRVLSQNSDKESEKKLYDHMKEKVDEIRASANRTSSESIWMTNIAYICGVTGVTWNTTARAYEAVNMPGRQSDTNRFQVNQVLPTVQNRLARLTLNPPKYDVMPNSNSNDDKDAARLGIDVLVSLWDKLTINEKRLYLTMWVQQCGHGYMKVSWDDEAGEWIDDPETGERIREGEVGVNVVSPFEIFADPLAKSFDDVMRSWLIQAKVRKLDYFRMRYGDKGEQVKAEDAWLLSSQYEQRINSMNVRGPANSSLPLKNVAIELVKYEAPTKDRPNGRMIIGANGVILEDKELPCGEIPFAKFDDVIVAGKYYPESIVTHLRPIQDQYNETVRRRAAWTRTLLAGKYLVARGHNLGEESLNDVTEVVEYDAIPGQASPEALQVPTIPEYAYAEEDRLKAQMNDISGIGQVSQGQMPSASIPAIGMQLLVEQDSTRIGVVTTQHEFAWARVGKLILKYVEFGYKTPRKLKLAGSNTTWVVKEISGDDLYGNTDVIVKPGSTIPNSKVLRRQEIINTYQLGLYGNPSDPKVQEKVLAQIEFGDMQGSWEDYAIDMRQIKRGMEQLEQGEPVIVNEFDNHTLWLQELNRYRKSDKYEQSDPIIQALILDNMEQHLKEITKLANPGLDAAMSGEAIAPPDQGMPQDPNQPPPNMPQEGPIS